MESKLNNSASLYFRSFREVILDLNSVPQISDAKKHTCSTVNEDLISGPKLYDTEISFDAKTVSAIFM